MDLIISSCGQIRCIYDDTLELAALGRVSIARASRVEPDAQGRWFADLAPLGGPVLGPFARRGDALAAEVAWLTEHWLHPAV